MLLKKLLRGIPVIKSSVRPLVSIDRITFCAQSAANGSIYAAVKGHNADGHSHLAAALKSGAICLIDNPSYFGPGCILVPDSRAAAAEISANLYGRPAERLRLIAVTGTAGKTTVCYMIQRLLNAAGHPCGIIGTVENAKGEDSGAALTTPLASDLHRILADYLKAGMEFVVMEASSQAIDQGRLHGLHFEVGVFTNLGRDHLDYHKTIEGYFATKARLFEQCEKSAINADDEFGARLLQIAPNALSFSLKSGIFTANNIRYVDSMAKFTISWGDKSVAATSLPGPYAVSNTLAALSAAVLTGVEPRFETALFTPASITGRMERVDLPADFSLYIDFAHTPEELSAALGAARRMSGGRVIAVFGCGGDRDREKRPLMAAASCAGADLTVLTSCNPRTENPESILHDMACGVPAGGNFVSIVNRRTAIEFAMRAAAPGDLILLAGKGHEMHQIIGTRCLPFDERAESNKIFMRLCSVYSGTFRPAPSPA